MRYLAILKDSFREAVDSKVMYVLFALTVCAVAIVATISFKPLPARGTMELFFLDTRPVADGNMPRVPWMFLALHNQELKSMGLAPDERGGGGDANLELAELMSIMGDFTLANVEVIRGEPDSSESDYLLTIRPRNPRFRSEERRVGKEC